MMSDAGPDAAQLRPVSLDARLKLSMGQSFTHNVSAHRGQMFPGKSYCLTGHLMIFWVKSQDHVGDV